MRKVSAGCFSVIFLFLYQGDSATLKWKTANDTLYLNEPEIIKDYKIPQATIKLIKPKGFSISIPGEEIMHLIEINVYATNLSYYRMDPICTYEDNHVFYYTNQTEITYTTTEFAIGDGCEVAYHLYVNLKHTTLTFYRYKQYIVRELENGTIVYIEDKGKKLFARESNETFTFERVEEERKKRLGDDFDSAVYKEPISKDFHKFVMDIDNIDKEASMSLESF